MKRPMPPLNFIDPLTPYIQLIPAAEVLEWVNEKIVSDNGELSNPDHFHLADADIGFMWASYAFEKQGRAILGQAEQVAMRAGGWQKARMVQQMHEWFDRVPEFIITLAADYCAQCIRYPLQVGDKGVTISASVSIKNASGLGVGLPNMSLPPSLTALYFMPISNVEWSPQDGKKVVVYGPEGVICKDEAGTATVIIEKDKVTINAKEIYLNGAMIHLNGQIVQDADQMPSGTTARLIGPLLVDNDTTAGGISLTGHKHDVNNVEPGSSTRTSEKPQ